MITLSVTVEKRVADWTPNVALPQIYSGSSNVDMIKFILDDEWSEFTNKKALLSNGTQLWEIKLNENNMVDIPSRLSESPCFMKIGVSGTSPKGEIITSSILVYQIGKGSSIKPFIGDTAFKSLTEKIEQALTMRSLGEVYSEYYLSDNPNAVDDESVWTQIPQTPTQNMPYLWSRFRFDYTNGQSDYTQPTVISVKGPKGDQGIQGPRGEIDNLGVGSVDMLGGVRPVAKAEDMNNPVGVDSKGQLWSIGGKYTIDFVVKKTNEEGEEVDELLTSMSCASGILPSYSGKDLVSEDGRPFDKWSPELAPVGSDATYTATFKHKVNYYNGSTLAYTEFVSDDTLPTHAPKVSKPKDSTYTYTFAGWSANPSATTPEELDYITSDTNYYAVYDKKENAYQHLTSITNPVSLKPEIHYEMDVITDLEYMLIEGYDGAEWKFAFKSGDTPAMVVHPANVDIEDFETEANTRTEVNILQAGSEKYLVWKGWELE